MRNSSIIDAGDPDQRQARSVGGEIVRDGVILQTTEQARQHERRRAPRTAIALTARLRKPGVAEVLRARVINVSPTGLLLQASQALTRGERVACGFTVDRADGQREQVVAQAEVVRRERGARAALRFLRIDARHRQLIGHLTGASDAPATAPEAAPLRRAAP